jgi:hypothetical protein
MVRADEFSGFRVATAFRIPLGYLRHLVGCLTPKRLNMHPDLLLSGSASTILGNPYLAAGVIFPRILLCRCGFARAAFELWHGGCRGPLHK